MDLGKARIGTAYCDFPDGFPTPGTPIAAIGTLSKDAQQVFERAKAEQVTLCVIGLPLLDGNEVKMASVVRRFGTLLIELGLRVEYVDETMTSRESDDAMRLAGIKASQRKHKLDGEAAARILEQYLSQHGS